MAISVTLRPDGQRDSWGTWFEWPTGWAHYNTVNDNSDGSFVDGKVCCDGVSPYKHFDLQSTSLPAGFVAKTVQLFTRIGAVDGGNGFPTKQFELELYHGNWNLVAQIPDAGGTYNTTGNPITVSSSVMNYTFTQAQLNDFWIFFGGLYSSNFATGDYVRLYDAWVVITYDVPPITPTPVVHTSASNDYTPSFSTVVSNAPDTISVKARFEIYENDGTTFVGSVDSGFVASGATATAEYLTLLAAKTYKVRAKAISSNGLESGYTGFTNFTIVPLGTLTGTGNLTAAATTVAIGAANLSGAGALTATAEQSLCLYPYIVYVYGGAFFCVENLGDWTQPIKSNVRELCLIRC